MSRSSLSTWQRFVLYTLGASIGAILAVLYVRKQMEEQTDHKQLPEPRVKPIIVPGGERRLAPRPQQAIILKAAGEAHVATSAPPLLTLEASPRPFKRREEGTIIAQTQPGATCTISARYSTGRTPNSLKELVCQADGQGECRWTWDIGTAGDSVKVEVTAARGDHEPTTKLLTVPITD